MPQIGWFEIIIIVVLAILVIGPKEFPIVVRKIGNWIGSVKRYFNEIQENFTDIETSIEETVSEKNNNLSKKKEIKKDER